MIKASEARRITDNTRKEVSSWNIDPLVDKIVAKIDSCIITESKSVRNEVIVWWSDVFDKVFSLIRSKKFLCVKYEAYPASGYDIQIEMTYEVMQRLKTLYSKAGYEEKELYSIRHIGGDGRDYDLVIKW